MLQSNFEMLENYLNVNKPNNKSIEKFNELKVLNEKNFKLNQDKLKLEEEFESLSQCLFEEANKLVAESRKLQSNSEQNNKLLLNENKSLRDFIKNFNNSNSSNSKTLPMTIPPPPKPNLIKHSIIQTRSSLTLPKSISNNDNSGKDVNDDDIDDDNDDLKQSASIVRPLDQLINNDDIDNNNSNNSNNHLPQRPSSTSSTSNSVNQAQSPPTTRLNRVRQSWFSKFRKPARQSDDPFDLNQAYGALMSLDDDDDENDDQQEILNDNNSNNNISQFDKSTDSTSLPKSPSFPTLATSSKVSNPRTSSFPSIPQLKSFT